MWVAFHLPADSQEHTTSQNMVQNLRPATQRFWTLGSETIHSKWSQWHCRPKPKSISWFLDSSPKKKESSLMAIIPIIRFAAPERPAGRFRGSFPLEAGSPPAAPQKMDPALSMAWFSWENLHREPWIFPWNMGGGPEVSLCFTRMVGKKIRVMISFPPISNMPQTTVVKT